MNKPKYILVALFLLMLMGCGKKVENENIGIKDTVIIQNSSDVINDIEKSYDDVLNVIEVTTNIVNYNDGNVLIKYPSISGLDDKNNEEKINQLIKKEVLSYLQPIDNIVESQHYKLSFEVKYQDDNVLSVVYTGSEYSDESAYPIDIFFTTNIDLINSKKLKLKELVVDENKLLEAFLFVLNEGCDDEMKNFAFNYILQNFDEVTLINGFNEADETYGLGRYIFSYLTEDSLGISWEVPHVSGDHVEVEIPLDMLEDVFILE